jgi:hypothetical protein
LKLLVARERLRTACYTLEENHNDTGEMRFLLEWGIPTVWTDFFESHVATRWSMQPFSAQNAPIFGTITLYFMFYVFYVQQIVCCLHSRTVLPVDNYQRQRQL